MTDTLRVAWAEGGLTANDLYVGFESEAEQIRLLMKRARLDSLSSESQRWHARFRQLADGGASDEELLAALRECEAVSNQVAALLEEE